MTEVGMSGSHVWRAQWIGARRPDEERPDAPAAFGRTLFRRAIDVARLEAGPATIRISADSSYVLYVNGEEIARGPQRGQPRRKTHDLVPLRGLRPGRNAIAVLVTWFGESNAVWQAPVPSGRLGAEAGLLAEIVLGDDVILSDASWRAIRSDAWTGLPRGPLDGVPAVACDARALPADWAGAQHDDAHWAPAEPLGAAHRGWTGSARPPLAPYGAVPLRTVGERTERVVRPTTARAAIVEAPSGSGAPHPARRAAAYLRSAAYRGSAVAAAQETAQDASVPPAHALVAEFDLGRVVSGVVEVRLSAPAGTEVDLAFLERPDAAETPLTPLAGARYVARGTDDAIVVHEASGMRTLVVAAVNRTASAVPIAISGVRIRERLSTWREEPYLASSDPELERLWRAGVRTVALNTADLFTDCPTREQRAWVGDGVVHQMVHLAANADWGTAREYLRAAASPRADGILPMSVAGDFEAADGVTIPSWSLHWIHGLAEMHAHAGPVPEVVEGLPVARGVLAWFARHADEDGVIRASGEWDLVDWSSVVVAGRSAALTALWSRALREYAGMCASLGDRASADWAQSWWERARAGFEAFWDGGRGLYVDADGPESPVRTFSQATNASAVVAGLVPDARRDALVAAIADPEALVERAWLSAPGGGLDMAKWERVARGEWVIDWDPRSQIVRAEPFLSYVVHDAYLASGRADLVDRAIRDWSRFLADGYDTFGEGWSWGSPCHGWSATPTRDIVRAVLGVTPAEPGYSVARIAPRPGGASELRGAVPTPAGPISVEVSGDVVRVSSPIAFVFCSPGGAETTLAPGEHVLSLATGHALPPHPEAPALTLR
ncbi:hypothetical protein [Microbacterium marinilacus]|uniref:Alpha-L-rhamnosidase six-hairpin glycosidase domain-containing protein n=1 Tax=Microbacterium marinilacus TaxID=415209 RepID=A0ABP7BMJ4_9MICO|nr:hypothetical protein [Microbacterium marinilacus]MBY0690421.1 hypothetical protein [Microbacterium marinilacus]